jgi:hypothetical protein
MNFLGTGSDPADALPAALHEDRWLGVSGPCAGAEQGDPISAISDGNYQSGVRICFGGATEDQTDGSPGDLYDPHGYFYAIDVPDAAAGLPLYIDLYDASHCTATGASAAQDPGSPSDDPFVTEYGFRGPDATPAIPQDNPVLATPIALTTSGTNTGSCATAAGWRNTWRQAFAVAASTPGRYYLQVQTEATPLPDDRHGQNHFAVRTRTTPTWDASSPCTADPSEDHFEPTCSTLSAPTWLGHRLVGSTSIETFPLVRLPDDATGALVVDMWDPGEGGLGIEMLDPLNRSVSFGWEVINRTGADAAPAGGWTGAVQQLGGPCPLLPPSCAYLDTSGTGPAPGPNRSSNSQYNDRLVRLIVDLPDDLQAEYGTQRQYATRWTNQTWVTDRTTWRAFLWETGTAP